MELEPEAGSSDSKPSALSLPVSWLLLLSPYAVKPRASGSWHGRDVLGDASSQGALGRAWLVEGQQGLSKSFTWLVTASMGCKDSSSSLIPGLPARKPFLCCALSSSNANGNSFLGSLTSLAVESLNSSRAPAPSIHSLEAVRAGRGLQII